VQRQAAVERTEDRVHLVRSCTPSPSYFEWRRTSRPRLSSSGAVSQRPRCLRRRPLTMRTHITHALSSCYSALRQIRSIMPSLSSHALNALVTAVVHSRLDYCNVVFAGLPACDIQRLQSVLNTAVRLVAGLSRPDHAFSLLRDRHWLPVKQRVEYKLFMMVHRCLYGDAPSYMLDLIMSSADATVRGGLTPGFQVRVSVPFSRFRCKST